MIHVLFFKTEEDLQQFLETTCHLLPGEVVGSISHTLDYKLFYAVMHSYAPWSWEQFSIESSLSLYFRDINRPCWDARRYNLSNEDIPPQLGTIIQRTRSKL